MKKVHWLGTSLNDLKAFPVTARQEAGYQLDKVQRGLAPTDWKPMKEVGPGVREIRITEPAGAFRVVYVTEKRDAVYVLHSFQKKTPKTSKQDIELARKRFREI